MPRPFASLAALLGLTLIVPVLATAAAPNRHSLAVERYGLQGYTQPIGLHHGFHITSVDPKSPAAQDHLEAHDVIVKVDGETIRGLEHFESLMADAYEDDGKVVFTILKHRSLEHHVLNGDLRGRERPRTAEGAKGSPGDDKDRR